MLIQDRKIPLMQRQTWWPACIAMLLLSACLLLAATLAYAKEPQPKLRVVKIDINGVELEAELAASPIERQRGLSYRTFLAGESGMLFVYQQTRPLLFTMKETQIPLSIAFISEDFVINEILKMAPFEARPYPSALPARYALEVNQGWFERKGIKAGDRIQLVVQ